MKDMHTAIGWIGTILALVIYGLFAAGYVIPWWFFTIGCIASVLLGWAMYKDKAYYGAFQQAAFFVFNIVGAINAGL
jgi:hypothetical protein